MTQAVNLANFANNLDSSGGMSPSALNAVVPISKGGTNASTSAGAAANLVVEIGKLLFPVGSIYTNATNSANPSTYLGFGTWAAFGAGRVPVGFDATNPLFDTAEETGGSYDATLPAHTHTGTTSTVGDHTHSVTADNYDLFDGLQFGGNFNFQTGIGTFSTGPAGAHNHSFTTNSTGSSATNANLQPYITVYMWKRTA